MTERPRRRFDKTPDPGPDREDAALPAMESGSESAPDNLVLVGRVLTNWGVQGEMRVMPATSNPGRFRQGRRLILNGVERRIVTARPAAKGQFLISLDGITTPEQAAAFRGADLYVPAEDAPPLEQDWYYHFQLIGLNVVTDDGRDLGVLVQVLETGANDVYIIRNDAREYLIPAIADVVQEVDLDAKRMTIHALPGLLD